MIDVIGTLGPATSFISSILEQFKPNRSPYLLTVSGGALFTALTLDSQMLYTKQVMILFPIYMCLIIIVTLSFSFRPYSEDEVNDSTKGAPILSDIDNQFKLSRTTGLIVGIGSLFMLAKLRADVDYVYIAIWSLICFIVPSM